MKEPIDFLYEKYGEKDVLAWMQGLLMKKSSLDSGEKAFLYDVFSALRIPIKFNWGIDNEAFSRLEGVIQKSIDKYEPGMDKQPKAPGDYPCCDALHEIHSSISFINRVT
ncbi:hypothetical protein LCGC14_0892560 [marine sediment metagenome]|uniref:Uncharacterized protein n=1 Tax=marine sediment metagenome TaxID=412755 RepID=A0A0F9S5T5_9ZZZZ